MSEQDIPDPVGEIRLTVFRNGDINVTQEYETNEVYSSSATYENRYSALHAAMTYLDGFENIHPSLFSHELRSGDTDART